MNDNLWRGTVLEPAEFYMLNERVGDMTMNRDLWENLGRPGHDGVFEYADRRWLVGRLERIADGRIRLRVRAI